MKTSTTFTANSLNPNRFSGRTDASWGIFGVSVVGKGLFRGGYSGLEQIEEIRDEWEGDNLLEAGAHPENPDKRSGRYRQLPYPNRTRRCA